MKPKKINVLPPAVYNLLSAGEVVENPSAIVKECIENSIDAGATKIEIEIARGGLDKIRIADNGCGVSEGDVESVFLPHATSKISGAKDLESIGTLGFRGEAMSSIGAVSQVDFKTATDGANIGIYLRIDGGRVASKKPIARSLGTEVVISNLFYNTPARAKFLRPANAEKNAVTSVVERAILANPAVGFRYSIDGEIIYDYSGKTLLDAIYDVYGDVTRENLLPIDVLDDGLRLFGYIGTPTFIRRNRSSQVTIVNGRPVETGEISDAVNEVFSNYMTVRNYPFFVLCLTVDLSSVDVNVHPRKAEIKFSDAKKIYDFVFACVMNTIDKHLQEKHKINFDQRTDDEMLKRISFFQNDDNQDTVKSADHIMNHFDLHPEVFDAVNTDAGEKTFFQKAKPVQQKIDTKAVDKFKILGTVFGTYVLIEDDKFFHLIDQHAAHERLLFDRLSSQIDNGAVEKQRLLEPEILVLTPEEITKMEESLDTLNACGIECAPFGKNCFRVTAVPVLVATHGIGAMLDAILGEVRVRKLSDTLREKIVTQCCKSAVKAGQNLPTDEIKKLVNDIVSNKTTPTCPHGRPIIKTFSPEQIEKMFARK